MPAKTTTTDLFLELQSRWFTQSNNINIQNWQSKIQSLCCDTSDLGPNSVIELLCAMGDEALCILLCEHHGQIYLRDDWSFPHPKWAQYLYTHILQNESCWTPLLHMGAFDYMLINIHHNTPIRDLPPFDYVHLKHVLSSEGVLHAGVYHINGNPYAPYPDERLTFQVRITHEIHIRQLPIFKIFYAPSTSTTKATEILNIDFWQCLQKCNQLSITEGLTPAFTLSDWTPPKKYTLRQCLTHVQYHPDANGYRLLSETEWMAAHTAGIYTSDHFNKDSSNGLFSPFQEKEWVLNSFRYLPDYTPSAPLLDRHAYFSSLRNVAHPTQRYPVLPSQNNAFRVCRTHT